MAPLMPMHAARQLRLPFHCDARTDTHRAYKCTRSHRAYKQGVGRVTRARWAHSRAESTDKVPNETTGASRASCAARARVQQLRSDRTPRSHRCYVRRHRSNAGRWNGAHFGRCGGGPGQKWAAHRAAATRDEYLAVGGASAGRRSRIWGHVSAVRRRWVALFRRATHPSLRGVSKRVWKN